MFPNENWHFLLPYSRSYLFPVAAITSDDKLSGLKQHKGIS